MTAIWRNDGAGWRFLAPSGFPDEDTLHGLVADAPQILPLSGAPRLTVIGREVQLGENYADLLAVEPSGRLAVVEIKLARNAEARRAVVAQILTYAAFLRGLDPTTLERQIFGLHLRKLGHDTLGALVDADDQEGSFDATTFAEGLAASLAEGRFRLVLVLDEAPEELVRLVGYLESVAEKLVIDLVTVAAYDIGGSQVIVPQRIDLERPVALSAAQPARPAAKGWATNGAGDFVATIDQASPDQQPILRRLVDWAAALERDDLARLVTYHGTANNWTLQPRLPADGVCLVTIYNDRGSASLSFHRTVFERRAPATLPRIEQLAAPTRVGQGTNTRAISEQLLAGLTLAYQEAAAGVVSDAPAGGEENFVGTTRDPFLSPVPDS